MARIFALAFILVGFMASALIGFSEGQSSVRRRTVVEVGSPFYRGVYHGECATINDFGETMQACATEKRS